MNKVRLGIIGLGNIGQHHAAYLSAGKVSRAELVAVSDAVADKLEKYKPLKTFIDGEELMRSGLVDAVVIATPHFQHTTLGIAALKEGLHAMVEKPISAHVVTLPATKVARESDAESACADVTGPTMPIATPTSALSAAAMPTARALRAFDDLTPPSTRHKDCSDDICALR